MPVAFEVHPQPVVRSTLEPVRARAVGRYRVLRVDQHTAPRPGRAGRVDDELATRPLGVVQRVGVDERDLEVHLEAAQHRHRHRRRERGRRVVARRPEHHQHGGPAGHYARQHWATAERQQHRVVVRRPVVEHQSVRVALAHVVDTDHGRLVRSARAQ